jgi:secondary thiamine-phosphate synthase enzyme
MDFNLYEMRDFMKSYRKELWFQTKNRREFINITPKKPYSQYRHNGFEDNADAHMKRTIMGREVVMAVSQGKLDTGPWEQVFYGEFDGKRKKRVLVKIIGE